MKRHCYECGKKLMAKRGGGYLFAIAMVDGVEMHVHHACKVAPAPRQFSGLTAGVRSTFAPIGLNESAGRCS